ncbi:MAG: 4'-phosphopantetheinyl transferase family protein [Kiloniellaceae bacterium]
MALPQEPRPGAEKGSLVWHDLDDVGRAADLTKLGEEVHLWLFALTATDTGGGSDAELLSSDEAARAARFRRDRDRQRFTKGRATMRRILASYLGANPAALGFAYGAAGKPELDGLQADGGLRFNLSHSEDLALLAVTRGRHLGVDLECIRAARDLSAIARRFFAPAEAAALAGFAPPLYEQAFFAIWARKEALLKAFGAGLSLPLHGFCVSADPREPAQLVSTAFRPAEARRWSLMDVSLEPPMQRFRAALAIEGPLPQCRYFRLGIGPASGSVNRAKSSSADC